MSEFVAPLTRRAFVAAGLALGLAACASTTGSGGTGSSGSDADPSATRTVDTIDGPVTIPANPQRIVAIGFPEAMALLDLGITPVGLPTYLPKVPAYDAAAQIPRIDSASGDVDMEAIAALRPDVIIGSDFADGTVRSSPFDHAKLTAIAPTVLFEWKVAAGNWQNEATQTAAAVGREADMAALAAKMHQRAADIKSAHADVLGRTTWDLISGQPGSDWYLYGPGSSHGVVLGEAGIRFGAAAGQTDNFVKQSAENFGLLAKTDGLMVSVNAGSPSDPFVGQASYDALPAVRAGRSQTTQWFFPAGYQAAGLLLDDLEAALTTASRT